MRRTLEQFLAVFNSLAPSQRVTFAAIALLIPAGFLFFAYTGSGTSMVPLSYGKSFSLEEMRNAEQALKEAGFTKFKSEGRQILAPASEVEKYNAALLQSGNLPSHWAEELERKLESTSPFLSSSESLRQMREALLGKHLRRMILASPDFEDADVFWTPASSVRRFGKESRTKATIVVLPRKGHDLTSRQVQALRDAVTFAIADLKAADVTVYDQRNNVSHTPEDENDPLGGKVVTLLREAAQLYETRIKKALSHISPDVVVTVNVDLDPLQKSVIQSVKWDQKKSIEQTVTQQKKTEKSRQQAIQAQPGVVGNQPRALTNSPGSTQDRTLQDDSRTTVRTPGGETTYTESVPTMPKVVTVAVLIPEDYYAKALEIQKQQPGAGGAKTLDKFKEETNQAVRDAVDSAIPSSESKKITVGSFVSVKEEAPEIRPSTIENVTSLLTQWGGPVALALFALWALWMIRGQAPRAAGAPRAPEAGLTEDFVFSQAASKIDVAAPTQTPVEDEPVVTLNDRDVVQNMVRDNPEMAVAIIGKWLQVAR
jgi:flagellar biosynthesis/type III secretory pathway M-ring protein FliF/YscJ